MPACRSGRARGGRRDTQSAGEHIPPSGTVIEIHLAESKQLFNAIDPAPFREKDLDPKAEAFIVDWARELPANAPLTLMVLLDRRAGLPDEAQVLRDAVSQYFGMRSQASRQQLKRLFKVGRTSLLIGMLFLAVSFGLGELIESALEGQRSANCYGRVSRLEAGLPCGARLKSSSMTGGPSVRNEGSTTG